MTAPEDVGFPKNYLRPALLLLLAEGTSHGYELITQVATLGLGNVDPGGVYRCLRAMDEDGLVQSQWEPSNVGPARRSYRITTQGLLFLQAVDDSVAAVARGLGAYRRRYQSFAARPATVS